MGGPSGLSLSPQCNLLSNSVGFILIWKSHLIILERTSLFSPNTWTTYYIREVPPPQQPIETRYLITVRCSRFLITVVSPRMMKIVVTGSILIRATASTRIKVVIGLTGCTIRSLTSPPSIAIISGWKRKLKGNKKELVRIELIVQTI